MALEDLLGLQATFYITLAYVVTIYMLYKYKTVEPLMMVFWVLITTGLFHGLGASYVTLQNTGRWGYFVLELVNTALALVSAVMSVYYSYKEKRGARTKVK